MFVFVFVFVFVWDMMMRVVNVTMSMVMMVLALMVGHSCGSRAGAVPEREHASVSVFNVGGTAGWTLPTPANNINYTTWANSHIFVIGDILCMFFFLISFGLM